MTKLLSCQMVAVQRSNIALIGLTSHDFVTLMQHSHELPEHCAKAELQEVVGSRAATFFLARSWIF